MQTRFSGLVRPRPDLRMAERCSAKDSEKGPNASNRNVSKVALSDGTVCGLRTSLFLLSIFRLPMDSKDELLSHMFAVAVVTVREGIGMAVSQPGTESSTSTCTAER